MNVVFAAIPGFPVFAGLVAVVLPKVIEHVLRHVLTVKLGGTHFASSEQVRDQWRAYTPDGSQGRQQLQFTAHIERDDVVLHSVEGNDVAAFPVLEKSRRRASFIAVRPDEI